MAGLKSKALILISWLWKGLYLPVLTAMCRFVVLPGVAYSAACGLLLNVSGTIIVGLTRMLPALSLYPVILKARDTTQ